MPSIRSEERKLYAEVQELRNLRNYENADKDQTFEIEKKRLQLLKKQMFYHKFLIARDNIKKGEMKNEKRNTI